MSDDSAYLKPRRKQHRLKAERTAPKGHASEWTPLEVTPAVAARIKRDAQRILQEIEEGEDLDLDP